MRQPHAHLTRTPFGAVLTLLLIVIWLLTHRYQGLSQDARIYAMQALARNIATLRNDLYLQGTSQDRYSLFSPFYAQAIRLLGLPGAARDLTILFAAGFLAASWKLAQLLLNSEEAWLAVGTLIITVGAYGSYAVFHFSEDYLTARSAAEALIATALALYFGGFKRMGIGAAASALLIHPLMALPGLLLLIFLMLPIRAAALLAMAGIALAATLALLAPWTLMIMDPVWLDVVKERSQFLFLPLWSLRDWEVNLRPFASLALSAAVFADAKIRKLCMMAAMVGVSGLLVGLLASVDSPVALIVQGQAWRWVWITAFIGALLAIPTALRLWQLKPNAGPLCALLLIASWTLAVADSAALALVALIVYLIRPFAAVKGSNHSLWATVLVGSALLYWASPSLVTAASSKLQSMATIASLRLPLIGVLLLIWHLMRVNHNRWFAAGTSVVLVIVCVLLLPVAFVRTDSAASLPDVAEFADWRQAIPPSASVYVANGHDAASFAWFTLLRPNYLSLDQSAGVVFARATALEVQRRSLVLLPLMDQDWKLLSKNNAVRSVGSAPMPHPDNLRALTAEILRSLCRDPKLGFLIAREDVGFGPLRHRSSGLWNDWNLYDCERVRDDRSANRS